MDRICTNCGSEIEPFIDSVKDQCFECLWAPRLKKYGLTIGDAELELIAQKFRCYYCGNRQFVEFEFDHRIAKSKGGGIGLENIQFLCKICNRAKRNLDPEEFVAWIKQAAKYLAETKR